MALIHDLLRRPDHVTYYVFRGRFASGATVAWGTRAVRHDSGLIDDRLAMPADITEGLPNALGAAPERAMTTLTLRNADRKLDPYMVGGAAPALEFRGDSWLNLSGKVYLGVVANGQIAEQAISPTMCLAGQASQQGGMVQLPMATRDELFFGKSKWVVTPKMIRDARPVDRGELVDPLYPWNAVEPFPILDWEKAAAFITESEERPIPWAYGASPIPLTMATAKGRARMLALGWVSTAKLDLSLATAGWSFCGETLDDRILVGPGAQLFQIPLEIDFGDELGTRTLWLVGMRFSFWQEVFDDQIHVVPSTRSAVGLPSGWDRASPANLIRKLIVDHSELGNAAVDHVAFDRAAESFDVAAFGGIYKGDAAIAELLQHICQVGYSIWVDTDDKVQILSHGAWSADEADLAKRGPLTHIRMSSIAEGTWREYLPTEPAERGAASSLVTIAWSGDQEGFWPEQYRQERAPGLGRTKLSQEVEARISGAWVHPPQSDDALAGAGSRRAFATRRFIGVGIGPETRLIPLGSLVRISHPLGSAAGGYEFRLGRLERRRVIPGEHGVELQVEDLGPIEHIKPGKLDDIANWIAFDPVKPGAKLELFPEFSEAHTDFDAFDQSMEGGSVWAFGAPTPENRRSFRIDKVLDARTVIVSPPPVAYEIVPASPPGTEPIDSAWLVMHTHESKGASYRPEYIRVAGPDGLLPGGDPGYAMMD